MKRLHFDCQCGAAGDMLSAALLELFPDREATLAALNAMRVPGARYSAVPAAKCGIAATRLVVEIEGHGEEHCHHGHEHHHEYHHHGRSLAEILQIVDALAAPRRAVENAKAVYKSLAEAESAAHGRDVAEIHFHEVGTADAIADVAAFCFLMDALSPDATTASAVNVGQGTVKCAHGILPVPAPATAHLLRGIPTYSGGDVDAELCTPTGAALIRHFVGSFGPQPPMRVLASGLGAGAGDFPRANVVRAFLGEDASTAAYAAAAGRVVEFAFDVDDMTGEDLAFAAARIFEAGAKDVAFLPAYMKKGRPGHFALVVCAPGDREAVLRAAFRHTTTLGIRERECVRHELARETFAAEAADGMAVRVKRSSGFGAEREKPEADDLAAYAVRRGISLAEARAELRDGRGRV